MCECEVIGTPSMLRLTIIPVSVVNIVKVYGTETGPYPLYNIQRKSF